MSLRAELREELYALTAEENLEAQRLLQSLSHERTADLLRRIEENRKGMTFDPNFDAGELIREVRDEACR